jgi:2-methylcitrate dehydratase PrpD
MQQADGRPTVAAGMIRLTEWASAAAQQTLPPPVRRRAAVVLADDLAAMVAASTEPQVQAARAGLAATSGPAQATVFAAGAPRLDRVSAASANGMAIAWCELDEGFRLVPCHAGAYVLPALLAEAEARGLTADQTLSAVAVAYDITARIALAFPFAAIRVHPHAAFATVGAAAGAALARGQNAATLLGSVSGAASMAFAGPFRHAMEGALVRNAWTSAGAWIGLRCAEWAEAGITGLPETAYDAFVTGLGTELRADELTDSLGERWAILDGYHKVYACCQYCHAAVEAALALHARGSGRGLPDEIVVETHERGLALNTVEPATTLAAKFSLPHAMAAVAATGTGGQPAFTEATLHDPDIARLRRRVRLTPYQNVAAPPFDRPSRVTWRYADGTEWSEQVLSAQGGSDRPFEDATLRGKFADLTAAFPRMAGVLTALLDGERGGETWASLVREMLS